MIVSPLIGSLVLFWMIDSRGILGSALQWMAGDPDLSLEGSTGLTWVMLMVYGDLACCALRLCSVLRGPADPAAGPRWKAAMIDGASRWPAQCAMW